MRNYCRELGIRWLVVFRRKSFRPTNLVQVNDMLAIHSKSSSSKLVTSKSAYSHHKSSSISMTNTDDSSADTSHVIVSDLPAFFRRRVAGAGYVIVGSPNHVYMKNRHSTHC
jgi:hypothetical protein